MDRLEEYIKKNRESLDIHTPSPEVWDRVNRELKPARAVKKWLAIAASVAVLTAMSLIFYQIGRNSVNPDMVTQFRGELPSKIQLKEAEAYYTSQINELYREAEPLLAANPELQDELNSDISQIDSIYADLKEDLKDNIANQDVVEALIRNYTIKIKILEDMLSILRENENNAEKNKSHEL
ncbi:MAG TPA: hypothetical protein VMV47_05650 [Bacteroidales bacterium]|nr:hypothetical protein [Bacteroidales bacterium]